jgi:hypothetical protein
MVDDGRFASALQAIRSLDCNHILGAHLPPARQMTQPLLGHLAEARHAPMFVGPDQKALEAMLAA